jgi:hypothetical protein
VAHRRAFRGTAIVALGALLLAISLLFDWAEPDRGASKSGITALLLPLALVALVLAAVARRGQTAWPFVYTRIVGACALVAILWAVFREPFRVEFGVLAAAIGAVMIASGSSAALSSEGQIQVRPPPG